MSNIFLEKKEFIQAIRQRKAWKGHRKYSNKKGLFVSPTRGLIIYDSSTDSFSTQLSKNDVKDNVLSQDTVNEIFQDSRIHTVFGDVFLLLEFIKQIGMLKILNKSFQDKIFLQRVLVHIVHGILKDGSKITCEDFICKSFLSYFIVSLWV